ncbi:hypothetical protein ARMGADRAFT_1100957 [Armillaria gallica]|uniref:Uncharacterized protein n=1 Tax=Armillaria gallica TaxID=47427 RepID=A0A2H3DYC5_ARMGA|nr:hypothetical protein ARMGADRAFT_1100957 [Armillaria gallica]
MTVMTLTLHPDDGLPSREKPSPQDSQSEIHAPGLPSDVPRVVFNLQRRLPKTNRYFAEPSNAVSQILLCTSLALLPNSIDTEEKKQRTVSSGSFGIKLKLAAFKPLWIQSTRYHRASRLASHLHSPRLQATWSRITRWAVSAVFKDANVDIFVV